MNEAIITEDMKFLETFVEENDEHKIDDLLLEVVAAKKLRILKFLLTKLNSLYKSYDILAIFRESLRIAHNKDMIKYLILDSPRPLKNNNTAFLFACSYDNVYPILFFTQEENNNIDINQGLLEACRNNAISVVQFLLVEKNADPNYENGKPLEEAIYNSNISLVRILLDNRADPNIDNSKLLFYAVNRFNDILYALLDAGGNSNAIYSEDEYVSLLLFAMQSEAQPILIQNLIVRYDCRPLPSERDDFIRETIKYNPDFLHRIKQEIIFTEEDIIIAHEYEASLDFLNAMVSIYVEQGGEITQAITEVLENAARPAVNEDGDEYEEEQDEYEEESEEKFEARRARIQQAREREEKNAALREAAVKSHKEEDSKTKETWITNQCINHQDLYNDDLQEENRNKIIILFFETQKKGECITKEELENLVNNHSNVALWEGPPSGVILSRGIQPGRRIDNSYVIKLPWSGNWVKIQAIEKAIEILQSSEEKEPFLILRGKKQSIGSSFGVSQLHGQWGGHWGYEVQNGEQVAIYVETNDFQPDERYTVYEL